MEALSKKPQTDLKELLAAHPDKNLAVDFVFEDGFQEYPGKAYSRGTGTYYLAHDQSGFEMIYQYRGAPAYADILSDRFQGYVPPDKSKTETRTAVQRIIKNRNLTMLIDSEVFSVLPDNTVKTSSTTKLRIDMVEEAFLEYSAISAGLGLKPAPAAMPVTFVQQDFSLVAGADEVPTTTTVHGAASLRYRDKGDGTSTTLNISAYRLISVDEGKLFFRRAETAEQDGYEPFTK